jgi:hypothetical protein
MVRIMCRRCLRFWDAVRIAERSSCPHCGGALTDGAEIPNVMAQVGHEDSKLTLQIYARSSSGAAAVKSAGRSTTPS